MKTTRRSFLSMTIGVLVAGNIPVEQTIIAPVNSWNTTTTPEPWSPTTVTWTTTTCDGHPTGYTNHLKDEKGWCMS